MKSTLKKITKKLFYTAPKKLQANFTIFTKEQNNKLSKFIEDNYLNRGDTKQKLSEWEYEQALKSQISERLDYNRNRIIPWLNKTKRLQGSKILEIGCGTGISTLALAEQGAHVTGIDVDDGALKVAEERLKLGGYSANICLCNGDELERFKGESFDFILYYAVFEHMTIEERIKSLKQAWDMLSEGALLTIIETPNRLWYYDTHTADLPFYDWLPDDLAYYYSKFSPRNNFKDKFREINNEKMLDFLRWGRGASYHEFEIAIAPLERLNVVSSLMEHEKTTLLKCGVKGLRYIKLLRSLNKNLPKGFCHPYLDLIIQK